MPEDAVKTASENPIILWIVIIVLAIVAILSGAKQIGGKVGELVTQWTTSRRRTADNAKAADRKEGAAERADMQKQIDYLRARSDERDKRDLERDERDAARDRRDVQRDAALVAHRKWDMSALQETNVGELIGPPPPLWPPAPSA